MTRASPDPDIPDAEWKIFREDERCEEEEEPRLNDPPEKSKVCGDCEHFVPGRFCGFHKRDDYTKYADDEACKKWEGEK